MMMTARKFAAILATMATLGSSGAWAAASPASPANVDTGRVITLRDVTTASTFVDLDHDGAPDAGDYFVFHEEYTRHGSVIEYNDSQCLVGFADQYVCHVVIVLTGRGQVVVAGSIAAPGGVFPADLDLAITGGTGEFSDAAGHAHAHHVSDTVSRDTLFLNRR